jgi:hypothetical protein
VKYKASRDLPQFARELKTLSPSKLAEHILNKRNEKRTPESITWWFKAHPEVYEELKKELVQGLPTVTEQVGTNIFQNGQFEECNSIKQWIIESRALKPLSEEYLKAKVRNIRQICKGVLEDRKIDFVAEGKWCLKHPDRLNWEDAKTILALMREKGLDPNYFARDLKSFLMFKGITEASRIKVGKPKGFGKYKRLAVKEETLNEMLEWVKEQDIEAYVIDRLMYKKGLRINAVLKLLVQDCKTTNDRVVITVFEKGVRSKYPKGKEIDRVLNPELSKELLTIIGDKKAGKVFRYDATHMAEINTKAIKMFCPEIIEQYGHVNPNHFWRHVCAQVALMKTTWNKALVAELYNWTEQALTESYGAPPEELVRQWHEKYGDLI